MNAPIGTFHQETHNCPAIVLPTFLQEQDTMACWGIVGGFNFAMQKSARSEEELQQP